MNFKKIFIIFFVLIITYVNTYSQNSNKNQQQQTQTPPQIKKIQVLLSINDLKYIYEAMNTVEIASNELSAFLLIQDDLISVLNNPQIKELNHNEAIGVDLLPAVAKNLKLFLDRVKIKGSEARQFKKIYDILINSINEFDAQNSK